MKAICGAKTRTGTPCQKPPARGATRCRMHGGATPTGLSSPHFRDGRYSRALPNRLATEYARGQKDTKLLELRDEIALTDARIGDLLSRVDSGESGVAWKALQGHVTQLQDAMHRQQFDMAQEHVQTMRRLLQGNSSDQAAWADVMDLIELRRRLVESERRRVVEMQQVITVEQAMALVGAITAIIQRHVDDTATLHAMSQELTELVGPAHPILDD